MIFEIKTKTVIFLKIVFILQLCYINSVSLLGGKPHQNRIAWCERLPTRTFLCLNRYGYDKNNDKKPIFTFFYFYTFCLWQ